MSGYAGAAYSGVPYSGGAQPAVAPAFTILVGPADATADGPGTLTITGLPASATADGPTPTAGLTPPPISATADGSAAVYVDEQLRSRDAAAYVEASTAPSIPAPERVGIAYVDASVSPTIEVPPTAGEAVAYIESDTTAIAKPMYALVDSDMQFTSTGLVGHRDDLIGSIVPNLLIQPAYTNVRRVGDDGVHLYGDIHVDIIFVGPDWINTYDVGFGIGGGFPGWDDLNFGFDIPNGDGGDDYFWIPVHGSGFGFFPGIPTLGRIQIIRRPRGKVIFDW